MEWEVKIYLVLGNNIVQTANTYKINAFNRVLASQKQQAKPKKLRLA